jgi:parvulin-like peptidyl-prolyl isomerase
MRRLSLGVLSIGLVPALAACNTSPGGAAVIGGNRISISTLQSQVNQSLASPTALGQLGGTRPAAVRQILSRLVQNQLIDRVAAAHKVTVTTAEVQAETTTFVSQNGGSQAALAKAAASAGFSASQLAEDIRQAALISKLETALTANEPVTQAQLQAEYQKDIDTYDELDIAQIEIASKTLAQSVLARAKAHPSTFAALAKQYSQDTQTAAKGGHVGLVGRSQVIQALGNSVASVAPGSIVMVHSSGGYVIVHVIARQTQPLSAVEDQLKAAIFSSQAPALLTKAVASESAALGVHISPRYGRWNAKTEAVAVTNSTISFAS